MSSPRCTKREISVFRCVSLDCMNGRIYYRRCARQTRRGKTLPGNYALYNRSSESRWCGTS